MFYSLVARFSQMFSITIPTLNSGDTLWRPTWPHTTQWVLLVLTNEMLWTACSEVLSNIVHNFYTTERTCLNCTGKVLGAIEWSWKTQSMFTTCGITALTKFTNPDWCYSTEGAPSIQIEQTLVYSVPWILKKSTIKWKITGLVVKIS